MEKFQSVEQVNSRLGEVERVFSRISELNQRAFSLTRDIQNLFDIWGEQVTEQKNPDNRFYQEKKERKEEINGDIQREIQKINEMGGIVKDIQKGLVDFYLEHDGDGIYLCWKLGDEKIKFWHPIKGGFAARRPLTELLQASYV